MRARKKPVEVEVVLFHKKEFFLQPDLYPMVSYGTTEQHDADCVIDTLEGKMRVSDGDIIIKGVHGEYYPCKPDIFEETYEMLN